MQCRLSFGSCQSLELAGKESSDLKLCGRAQIWRCHRQGGRAGQAMQSTWHSIVDGLLNPRANCMLRADAHESIHQCQDAVSCLPIVAQRHLDAHADVHPLGLHAVMRQKGGERAQHMPCQPAKRGLSKVP